MNNGDTQMKYVSIICAAALCAAVPANADDTALPAGTYTLDKSHASLMFNVSHLGFSNYTMGFDRFDATLQLDPSHPENASVTATVDPLSLDLPSPPEGFVTTITTDKNWLNATAFPVINFTSTRVVMTAEKTADIHGNLEMLGVSRPMVLHAAFNGGYSGHPMDPKARVGFSAMGSFKRSDFGMSYGLPAPGTSMGVGDEIQVIIEAEFSGPAMQAAAE
jgi:polyisoprenoid-binding protein YceI